MAYKPAVMDQKKKLNSAYNFLKAQRLKNLKYKCWNSACMCKLWSGAGRKIILPLAIPLLCNLKKRVQRDCESRN